MLWTALKVCLSFHTSRLKGIKEEMWREGYWKLNIKCGQFGKQREDDDDPFHLRQRRSLYLAHPTRVLQSVFHQIKIDSITLYPDLHYQKFSWKTSQDRGADMINKNYCKSLTWQGWSGWRKLKKYSLKSSYFGNDEIPHY